MELMQKVLEIYEITSDTMAILPQKIAGNICSLVKEVDDEFIVLQKPTDIIEHSCAFFGAGYQGRVIGTKMLTGITHKPPIAISPSKKIFFFPTASAALNTCIWISHGHVKEIFKVSPNETRVELSNHTFLILPISFGSLRNQLHRTAQLKSIYTDCENFEPDNRHFELVHEGEIETYIKQKKSE